MNSSEKGSSVPLNFANQSTTEGLAAGNGGDHSVPGNARQCCHLTKFICLYHEEALEFQLKAWQPLGHIMEGLNHSKGERKTLLAVVFKILSQRRGIRNRCQELCKDLCNFV